MDLTNITEKFIKDFAAPIIYKRGYDYFKSNMVNELEYDPENDVLTAEVEGSYGSYDVEIELDEYDDVFGDCTCPYEGYPCKHIVAVLLTFIKEKAKYVSAAKTKEEEMEKLKAKIKSLSKEQLVEILYAGIQKYPDFNRDLMVQLGDDRDMTLKNIFKSIDRALPNVETGYFNPAGIVKKLQTILKSVEAATSDMKAQVYWKVVDRILNELNSYGMDDEDYEDFALKTLDKLIEIFSEHKELGDKKREIIGELMDYYTWSNCGIIDSIYQSARELCSEKEDYQVMIEKLKRHLKKESDKSFYKDQLADLYAAIGDTASVA